MSKFPTKITALKALDWSCRIELLRRSISEASTLLKASDSILVILLLESCL